MTIKITNKLNKKNLLDLSGSRLGIKILGTICFSTILIGSSYWSYEKQNTRNTNNTKFLKITKLIPYPIAIPPIIIKTISCKLNLFAVKDHIPAIVPQTIIEPEEI